MTGTTGESSPGGNTPEHLRPRPTGREEYLGDEPARDDRPVRMTASCRGCGETISITAEGNAAVDELKDWALDHVEHAPWRP